jgi:hypothetical protein
MLVAEGVSALSAVVLQHRNISKVSTKGANKVAHPSVQHAEFLLALEAKTCFVKILRYFSVFIPDRLSSICRILRLTRAAPHAVCSFFRTASPSRDASDANILTTPIGIRSLGIGAL